MRNIDPRQLEPDEIAFCLETNGAIDARRFITFLDCLTRHEPGGPLPEFRTEILELSTGSFFGRLRFLWDSNSFHEDRMERIEETLDHIRTDLAAKDERVDDRALDIAQQSLDVARAGHRTDRSMLAVAVASVLLTFWQTARSEQESPCAEAVTAIMDHDGVSSIDLWCQGKTLRLNRMDVGMIIRRNDDDRLTSLGTSSARAANSLPLHSEGNQRIGDPVGTRPTQRIAAQSAVERSQSEVGKWKRGDDLPIDLKSLLRGASGPFVAETGRFERDGDVYIFRPAPKQRHQAKPALVIPTIADEDLDMQATYMIEGNRMRTSTPFDLYFLSRASKRVPRTD